MNRTRIIRRIGILLSAQILFLSPFAVNAQDDTIENNVIEDTLLAAEGLDSLTGDGAEDTTVVAVALVGDVERGKAYFQGGRSFYNGGPTCVACHNVTHEGVMPGGLFAKDLTDVYSRLGEGLVSWLGAPPFPAMASTYNNNPLTEQEKVDLTAFFKYANETKDTQVATSGVDYFFIGGGLGLACLLVLIQLLWSKRKKKMVKSDIFARQNKAWDAKF